MGISMSHVRNTLSIDRVMELLLLADNLAHHVEIAGEADDPFLDGLDTALDAYKSARQDLAAETARNTLLGF